MDTRSDCRDSDDDMGRRQERDHQCLTGFALNHPILKQT